MSHTSQSQLRAVLLIVLSSCGFGSLSTLVVLINRAGFSLLPTLFWRYLLAVGVLFLFVRQSLPGAVSTRQAFRLMIVGGLGQAAITYLSLRALDYLPVGPLAFLFYTYPAWVALIASITGKEELTRPRLLALAVAMSGIVAIVGVPSGSTLNTRGIALALGTAILYAVYLPALHKVQQGIPPLVSAFYLLSGVLLSFLIVSTITGQIEIPGTLAIWVLLAAISLFSTVVAFVSLIAGLRLLGPLPTSIIAAIEPFFTALLGVFLLGERLTLAIVAGGFLIALAVILLQTVRPSLSPAVSPSRSQDSGYHSG